MHQRPTNPTATAMFGSANAAGNTAAYGSVLNPNGQNEPVSVMSN